MDEPKKRKSRTNPEQPKKRGRRPMTEEERAAAREKRKQELAENPDKYKKEWSMTKAESLRGGAMQSLERYCTATNEEISQLMGNVVKFYELGKLAPVTTDDECEQRIDAYFQYIIRTGEKPSLEKLALALGVTRRALEYWKTGERGSARRQAMINYAIETLAAMDAELVNNNKIPQVTWNNTGLYTVMCARNFLNCWELSQETISIQAQKCEGSTTIPKGSTPKRAEMGSILHLRMKI